MKLSSVIFLLPFFFPILLSSNTQDDYKKNALCVEIYTEGVGWTHTFGEGKCPPGSNKGSNENQQNIDKISTIVEVTKNAQQAVIALGELSRQKRITNNLNKNQVINKFRYVSVSKTNKPEEGDSFFKLVSEENVELSIGIGGVVLFLVQGNIQNCFTPKFDTNYPYKSGKWFILQDQPLCNIPGEDAEYFYPFYSNENQPTYNSIHPVTFDYKKRKDLYRICVKVTQKIACKDKAKFNIDFKKSLGFVYNLESPKKMVIVSKFDGNLVDIIESYFDTEKKDFVEILRTVDINKDKTLYFFDQKIEILRVQDNELVYKIVKEIDRANS